ncbi:MAG: type II CAAX prenyl endopeptidase Rce1 family protein [Bryobacteraceae bacterium]
MTKTLGGFRAALLAGWLALGAAGVAYARLKDIPAWLAAPLLAAFLLEYSFYLAAGFEAARGRLARPWLLAASMLLPYLVYTLGTGRFAWNAAALLAALAVALSFWHVLLPRSPGADLGYLALLAAALLTHYFDRIYPPAGRLEVDILGQLAMIHVSAIALLEQRRAGGTGFGFLPSRAEWKSGALHFLYFLPVGLPVALALGAFRLGPVAPAWKIAGTFLGIFWVVALSEEFFFRGLLQQWLEQWTGSAQAALVTASILFGAVHLGFREFPNWRFALVAAIAGWFYGRAYLKTRSIRASMVAHALVVTTWRALFV